MTPREGALQAYPPRAAPRPSQLLRRASFATPLVRRTPPKNATGLIVRLVSRSFLAMLAAALLLSASPAFAQKKAATRGVVHSLPAKSRVQGRVVRLFCEKSFRVGDTISAMIGP